MKPDKVHQHSNTVVFAFYGTVCLLVFATAVIVSLNIINYRYPLNEIDSDSEEQCYNKQGMVLKYKHSESFTCITN